jgi:hypothetical protein
VVLRATTSSMIEVATLISSSERRSRKMHLQAAVISPL